MTGLSTLVSLLHQSFDTTRGIPWNKKKNPVISKSHPIHGFFLKPNSDWNLSLCLLQSNTWGFPSSHIQAFWFVYYFWINMTRILLFFWSLKGYSWPDFGPDLIHFVLYSIWKGIQNSLYNSIVWANIMQRF